ncbi:piRNA biogenesis protein EXD1 isoform X3 [Pezoporus wallicus]|uniref:piRNA biogenesis protein EXD1 isoform X3 n=1 Tax=Pezoporus wallicus TaxID=35540 RepID=UPI00254EFEB5|nr:piRNA biogenesis protein EXD1 isoform X3 [Pezoporus wallicus]
MALSSEGFSALLGRAVKVTLKCGVFQGVLQHVNPDRSLLLRTVKNLETGRSSPGIKMFFGAEIVNVELLDEPDSGKGTTVLSEWTSAVEGNKQADKEPAGCRSCSSVSIKSQLRASNSLKCSLSEKKEEENVDYTVIDSFHEKFGPAVLHLKQQCVVSIAGEGVNLCRYGKLSWLEIASKSCIFLFDIFLLGPQAFKNGLQMLLEDKNILKVMHDCRWISDCLFHQYGVLLFNVFDTQENPDIWFLRPFPPSLLKALALKAMHLLLLHSSLMENLMSDLTAVVHDYLNAYRSGSADHLWSTKVAHLHGAAKGAASALRYPDTAKRESSQKLQNEQGWSFDQTNTHGIQKEKQPTGGWKLQRWIPLPQIKACPILHPSTIGMYFVKKSLKNQTQEVNLWKNLKPSSSWLNK